MTSIASPAAPLARAQDGKVNDLRAAAEDLHRQFLAEMLKQAKLTEALSGQAGGQADLGAALSSVAIDRIANDMARSQPGFTERLYAALKD